MFNLGRQTDYAARILLHLASQAGGRRVTARQIADQRLIPPAYIKRIVSRLSAARLVATVRGSGGGITLARPASEISLLEVVEAMEGPLSLNVCVGTPGECPLSDACPVRQSWCEATRTLAAHLAQVRFGDLAARLGPPRRVEGK